MNRLLSGLALMICCGFSTLPENGALEITLDLQFNGRPLILEDQGYHSVSGDSLFVDILRFYLTNFQLQGRSGWYSEPESYHLVDADVPGTQVILLNNVPAGQYDSLAFNLGTDSLINVSGAMGGDLDPTRGMYWAWNSGYINVKLEGRSPSCPTRHQAFEFHIGGYMLPYPTVRPVALPLKGLDIRRNATRSLRVIVDVAKFFNNLELRKTNQVMIPSEAAARMADYFKEAFVSGALINNK